MNYECNELFTWFLVEYESFCFHREVLVDAKATPVAVATTVATTVADGSESLQGVRQTPVGGSVGAEPSVAAARDEAVHEATLAHKSAGDRDDRGYGLDDLSHTKPSVPQSTVPTVPAVPSVSTVPSVPQLAKVRLGWSDKETCESSNLLVYHQL